MASGALEQRILDFVRDADTGDFGELALALFERQFESLPSYREHCEALGVAPTSVANWREIPGVDRSESGAFESSEPAEPGEFPSALVRVALPELFSPGTVWLLIDTLEGEAPKDSFVSRGQRLDIKQLRSWLGARQRDRRPVQIVAAVAGYANLIELLERRGLKFRLPPGSVAFCMTPIETAATASWDASLAERLGVNPEAYRRVIRGQASSTPLLEDAEGPSGSFRLPHWVRVTSSDSDPLAILDLASIGTPAHRIEQVTARVFGDGDGYSHTFVLA